jgi:hypothetical protein
MGGGCCLVLLLHWFKLHPHQLAIISCGGVMLIHINYGGVM